MCWGSGDVFLNTPEITVIALWLIVANHRCSYFKVVFDTMRSDPKKEICSGKSHDIDRIYRDLI